MKPIKPKKPNIFLLAALVFTLGVIGLYQLIPPRVYKIVPAESWRTELFAVGKESEIGAETWVDREAYRFRCEIQDSQITQLCGLNFFFGDAFHEGTNLSGFNNIKIKLKFRGDAYRFRIFLRNYNPEYSNLNDGNSAKFLSIGLNTSEFEAGEVVNVGLDEFTVPDWWLDQRELDRKFLPIEFSNISTIGIDFGPYLNNVKEIDVELESFTLEGPWVAEQHWYLGILIFWMSVTVVILIHQFVWMARRARTYSKVITDLVSDKADLEKESKKFQELSNLDGLTGALNRLGIEKSIDSIIAGQRSKAIGVILIDIDHFKRVNDHRGHDVGDLVLKTAVELVQNNIREHDLLGRWGGEEFVLITPNADEEVSYRIAEKIRKLLADHVFDIDKPLKVTASFGVTSLQPEENFDTAFKRADIALYDAKAQGRNCTVIADKN